VAESHPREKANVKNHNLGLEVHYRYGSQPRRYLPDFIVLADDGRRDDDLLRLNQNGHHGRWVFAESTDVYQTRADFEAKIEAEFNRIIESVIVGPAA
jgi:type III restriction enzyme